MSVKQNTADRSQLTMAGLLLVCAIGCSLSLLPSHIFADYSTNRCNGFGELQSISLTDWESGLGAWTVGRSNVANPSTFDTPDWAVVGNLPDGRNGVSAFVPNLVAGDCDTDDESGVLRLNSPTIAIPADAIIPRISFNHWFEIEEGWDGGNLKISINGSSFSLLPASAIEEWAYNGTLLPPRDEFGFEYNSNPLSNQLAFTGTIDGQPTGRWIQSRINLLGIADAGDTIQLRFEFGIDACTTSSENAVGWFVDDIEIYRCEAELPPSKSCGNGVINGSEECDDGNGFVGDGCSNTCTVETGWSCALPTTPGDIDDNGFEAGTPNPFWAEVSNNPIGTPICELSVCGRGGGSGPSQGAFWAWFGGIQSEHESSLSQTITIPAGVTRLVFDLEIPACDSSSDILEVLVDGSRELLVDGSDSQCGIEGYAPKTVNVAAYADGNPHDLEIRSETYSANGGVTNFFVDSITLPGDPSICRRDGTNLTLKNLVFSDNGGSAYPADWTLSATGPSSFSGAGPVVFSDEGFLPGTYDLSGSGPAGYDQGSWLCQGGEQLDLNTIHLENDETATCTLILEDIPPTLSIVKSVINDNGGTVTNPDAFNLRVDGVLVENNIPNDTDFGDHRVSEDGLSGYQAGTWGGDCNPDGTILLQLGQHANCTITNDDIPASLTLLKSIVNDDDGTIEDPNAFGLRIDGQPVSHNAPLLVNAGDHIVSEDGLEGYVNGSWSGDCETNGDITLELAQVASCVIENNDIDRTSLTLVNHVINNHGGSETASAWTLYGTGPTTFSGAGPSVHSGPGIPPGTYALSETGPPGYSANGWTCEGGVQIDTHTVSISLDESVTCTVNHDDIAPSLTLFKNIINDNGGDISDPNVFVLKIDGVPVLHGITNELHAGLHTASEDGLPEYISGSWSGDCDPDGAIVLDLGQHAACTVSNDDISATITVINTIVNDNGGRLTNPDLFGLSINSIAVSNNTAVSVQVGTHQVSQEGVTGYLAGTWGGDCNPDGSIEVAIAQNAVCTISNDDVSPTLTVIKTIVNDNGGTVEDPDAFNLMVDGNGVLNNAVNTIDAGYHVVSEAGLPGYDAGSWGGDCDLSGNVLLAPGQNATCTVENNDSSATRLILQISVNNNDGGTASGANWTIGATGPESFDGAGPFVSSDTGLLPGIYNLTGNGPAGYSTSDWTCTSGHQVDGDTVEVRLGEQAVCTISADDIAPTLRLAKQVLNNNGGNNLPDNWILTADGGADYSATSSQWAVGIPVRKDTYTLEENGPGGYSPDESWQCTGGTFVSPNQLSLELGESADCSITNDDETPTLTLITSIDGGPATTTDFVLRVSGEAGACGQDGTTGYVDPDGITGVSINPVESNCVYTISGDPVEHYSLTNIACINNNGGATVSYPVSLNEGQSVTCTVTNTWVGTGSISIVKQVMNSFGGTLTTEDFPLKVTAMGIGCNVDGSEQTSPYTVETPGDGCVYTISETQQPGYENDSIVCEELGGTITGASFTFIMGETWLCTVTNSDQAPILTLDKNVINDNGGQASADDWLLTATGAIEYSGTASGFWNAGVGVQVGTYLLSESAGSAGYSASNWACSGTGDFTSLPEISLDLGETALCTITNDDIAASLTLTKVVHTDNGGTSVPDDWILTADGTSDNDYFAISSGWSDGLDVLPDTYLLSESGPAGYFASGWDCTGGGDFTLLPEITLELGDEAVCVIQNDDISPSLTLVKSVTNDDGGTASSDEWNLVADGTDSNDHVGSSTGFWSGGIAVLADTYTLYEIGGPEGYSAGNWDCTGGMQVGNSITLTPAQSAICTLINDDVAATLTLVKQVTNDNGGTAGADEWVLSATGTSANNYSGTTTGFWAGGVKVSADTYILSDGDGPAGYNSGTWVCNGGVQVGNSITVLLGESVTCSIGSDDIAASLTVIKNIINDNGGTINNPNSFGLRIDGTPVSHNIPVPVDAGAHQVSEDGIQGYEPGTWGGDCDSDGNITLELEQQASCTITNDDKLPTLTLVKTVNNDNGGEGVSDDWVLNANGSGENVYSGSTTYWSSGINVRADTYLLTASDGPGGYDFADWVCTGGIQSGNSITIGLGETATCTLSSNDKPPSLTLVKTVINDNGGLLSASEWNLRASGPTGFNGPGPSVSSGMEFHIGNYDLSESGNADGYAASDWVCIGGTQVDGNTVSLALGESSTCTITNNDVQPTLTLSKSVVNDNGGIVTDPDEFNLRVDGEPVIHNVAVSLDAGIHTASEDGLPGYEAGTWGGDCLADGSITLGPGQNAACTITNNDIEPRLTLVKQVSNNDGGTALPSEWTLVASTPEGVVFSGSGPSISSPPGFEAGTYDLYESGGPDGYRASDWFCIGGIQEDVDSITLNPGDNVTCTITNNDIEPTLTLIVNINNDNGGTVDDPATFELMINGNAVEHSIATSLPAGDHTVTANDHPQYLPGDWDGDCSPGGTIQLDPGQDASCSITFDDLEPHLDLIKDVVNDHGGTRQPTDWTLQADGPAGFSGAGPIVSSGVDFKAGTYDLSENGEQSGYTASDWNCNGGIQTDGDTLIIAAGETVSCTITNNDIGPGLTLNKLVNNEHGGTGRPSDWVLTATGPTGFSGSGPSVTSDGDFEAGTYVMSESGDVEGYTPSPWVCDGGIMEDNYTVTIEPGEIVSCTITNTDTGYDPLLFKDGFEGGVN